MGDLSEFFCRNLYISVRNAACCLMHPYSTLHLIYRMMYTDTILLVLSVQVSKTSCAPAIPEKREDYYSPPSCSHPISWTEKSVLRRGDVLRSHKYILQAQSRGKTALTGQWKQGRRRRAGELAGAPRDIGLYTGYS